MQPATKIDDKVLEEERLLIRLADVWWRSRPGSPGFRLELVREAMKEHKIQEALEALNWKAKATDNELYAAFNAAISKSPFSAGDFDSWDTGDVDAEQLSSRQKSEHRKRAASKQRKKTAPAAITTTAKARPTMKTEAAGAWPQIKTLPLQTRTKEEEGSKKRKHKKKKIVQVQHELHSYGATRKQGF